MTGLEALELVRYWASDEHIGHYIELQRAVRQYCQHTGYKFLQEADDAVLTFEADQTEYNLQALGFRQIRRIWVLNSQTGVWDLMDEQTDQSFENRQADFTDSSGNVTTSVPRFYKINGTGEAGDLYKLTIGPAPSDSFQGRIDGLSVSPIISHNQPLPGPEEYHEVICRLAVGFHKQQFGAGKLKGARGQEDMMVAQALISDGEKWEARARGEFEKVVHDDMPMRLTKITWNRAKIAR